MRLDKLLELEKMGSKRQVKALVKSKKVRVDGKIIIDENQNVDAFFQEILVNNQRIQRLTHVYLMMNKPKGVVTAVKDKHLTTVMDLLEKKDQRKNLYPVGRLDRDTEGLLLLTDNGPLGYQLLRPNKKVTKRYQVIVNARLTQRDCQAFEQGILFDDGTKCQPAILTIHTQGALSSSAYLDITEGKFHQVKKMFLSVGKKVMYLKRISMGPLQLDQNLKAGSYRSLEKEEVRQLLPYFIAHKKERNKKMNYKTLLFDLDDTLLDFQLAEKKALQALFLEEKIVLTPEIERLYKKENRQLWKAYEEGELSKQRLLDTRFQLVFELLGHQVDGRVLDEKYRQYLSHGHAFLGNSQKIIHQLSKEYDIYIVTNGVAQVQYSRLKASGLDRLVKGIFISEEMGYQKPMKEYFDYVFERISTVDKAEVLMIGDSLEADILGGNRSGIDTVWLNVNQKKNQSEIQPTYEIISLDDLLLIFT